MNRQVNDLEKAAALLEPSCQGSPFFCLRRFLDRLRFDGDLVIEVSTSRMSEPVQSQKVNETKAL
jgi:hypothetical protein